MGKESYGRIYQNTIVGLFVGELFVLGADIKFLNASYFSCLNLWLFCLKYK